MKRSAAKPPEQILKDALMRRKFESLDLAEAQLVLEGFVWKEQCWMAGSLRATVVSDSKGVFRIGFYLF